MISFGKRVRKMRGLSCPNGSIVFNWKLKISVGGVPPQSNREDSQIKKLHWCPIRHWCNFCFIWKWMFIYIILICTNLCVVICRRIISAHTVLQQLPYIPKIYKNSRATMFCILANCLLDHNFPFSIFNFQFYARSGVICFLISYCIHE